MAHEWFDGLQGKKREAALKLHRLLVGVEPSYQVAPAWNGLGYKLGSKYSCLMVEYPDHLKLMLWRGKDLPDPDGVLSGTGKNTRHVRIDPSKPLPRKSIQALLQAQHALYAQGGQAEAGRKKRSSRALPASIRRQLKQRGLLDAYQARPPYQRTDYINWITSAKRDATQARRLDQMLKELEAGNVYMNMVWSGKRRP